MTRDDRQTDIVGEDEVVVCSELSRPRRDSVPQTQLGQLTRASTRIARRQAQQGTIFRRDQQLNARHRGQQVM